MANRTRYRCKAPYCKRLTRHSSGRCEAHRREHWRSETERKRERITLYASPNWRKFRKLFLLENPVCSTSGCTSPATVVDHIRRLDGPNDRRAFDPAECQALCSGCHDRKRARESGEARRSKDFISSNPVVE